jgi:hypothetical protein
MGYSIAYNVVGFSLLGTLEYWAERWFEFGKSGRFIVKISSVHNRHEPITIID